MADNDMARSNRLTDRARTQTLDLKEDEGPVCTDNTVSCLESSSASVLLTSETEYAHVTPESLMCTVPVQASSPANETALMVLYGLSVPVHTDSELKATSNLIQQFTETLIEKQGHHEAEKRKLSKLTQKEYVKEFTKHFTEKIAILDDIAKTILTLPVGHENTLYGVTLGVKKVEYQSKKESRPCMVVLVEDMKHARESLQKTIIEKVINVINSRSHEEVYDIEEDPFWLRFVLHKPEFLAKAEPAMFNGESPAQVASVTLGATSNGIQSSNSEANLTCVMPGDQICTADGTHGTVGLFIHANINGELKHYGVTCCHVAFDQQKCMKSDGITKEILSSCFGGSLLTPQGVEAALHKISDDHARQRRIQNKLVNHSVHKFELNKNNKTKIRETAVGAFQCCLYGILEPSDAIEEGTSCLDCNNKVLDKDFSSQFVDMALFSVDSIDQCGLTKDTNGPSSMWRIWGLGTLLSKPTVYTYNVRDGQLHTKSNDQAPNRACKRESTIDYYGTVTSLENGTLVHHPPHLRMTANDDINERLFVDNGDSGSLLFQEHGDGDNLILGILSSRFYEGNVTIAYGFYLQPALDVIASRLFLAEATGVLIVTDDALEDVVAIEGHIAAKSLKIADMGYSYAPCLCTCTSNKSYKLYRRCICARPYLEWLLSFINL